MPVQFFQFVSFTVDIALLVIACYYFLKFRTTVTEQKHKQDANDARYHHIVDDALAKERKILEDATLEAGQIIASAQYVSRSSKEKIDQALDKMLLDVQKHADETTKAIDLSLEKVLAHLEEESEHTSREYLTRYSAALTQLTTSSLNDFHLVSKSLTTDWEKKIKAFHESILPGIEKEIEEYKKARLQHAEASIARIIQKVSQETLNKTLSLDDHTNLLLTSLEKARKEEVFD